jgi:hypothetical protein
MSKQTLIALLVLYIATAGLSYAGFSYVGGSLPGGLSTTPQVTITPEEEAAEETSLASLLTINPSEPKDQPCPLNGQMYTKTEMDAWSKRRPLAVMIENTPDARPQSGMGSADVVYEAVAEGGVTRFMGMFYCGVQAFDTELAPIRSARIYYMLLAAGYNEPLYTHVGGANVPGPTDALGILSEWGWTAANDLNQFSIGYPTFVRDYNRVPGKEIATEHTMVTTSEKLWAVAAKRGWTNMSPETKVKGKVVPGVDWKDGYKGWTFEDGKASSAPAAKTISYDFWSGYSDYAVEWSYDSASNKYGRKHGGEVHVDENDNKPVMAANVIVLLATEKGPINEKKHMIYEVTGTGDALIFKNGDVIKATWAKKDKDAELTFSEKGKPVALNRGLTWVSVLGKTTKVNY